MKESNFYHTTSEEAAIAERSGDFKRAAELWINSSFSANSAMNRHWATSRSEYCIKQHHEGRSHAA